MPMQEVMPKVVQLDDQQGDPFLNRERWGAIVQEAQQLGARLVLFKVSQSYLGLADIEERMDPMLPIQMGIIAMGSSAKISLMGRLEVDEQVRSLCEAILAA